MSTLRMKDGDWVIGPDGQPEMVESVSKVGQDLVHALSHPYDSSADYGFDFLSDQNSRTVERLGAAGIVKHDVTTCVARLRRAQRRQAVLEDTEKITGIKQVTARLDGLSVIYAVKVGVGELRRTDVEKAMIITNRHRYSDRDR